MTKKAITTEYFENVKTVQDVRGIIIGNLDKLDDPAFIKDFKRAYNAHRSDQQGKYGRYQAKAAVTADGYIKIATAVRDLTRIKVGRSKIKLNVAFKLGGVNLSGDTKVIRTELKALGFRWNPKTLEWYNSFATTPTIPEIPKTVKAEKSKAAEPKATKTPPKAKKAADAKPEKAEPVKKALTKAVERQKSEGKVGKERPELVKSRVLEGEEKERAMAEFKARAAAKKAARQRQKAGIA